MSVSLLVGVILVDVMASLTTILSLLWTLPHKSRSHACTAICLPCKPVHASQNMCCGCESSRLKLTWKGKWGPMVQLSTNPAATIIFDTQYTLLAQTQYDDIISDEELQAKSAPEPNIDLKKILAKIKWTIKPAARYTGTPQPPLRQYDAGMIPLRAWKMGQRSFRRYGKVQEWQISSAFSGKI